QVNNASFIGELSSQQSLFEERIAVPWGRQYSHQNSALIDESEWIGDNHIVSSEGVGRRRAARRNHLLHLGGKVGRELPCEDVLRRPSSGLRSREANPCPAITRVEVELINVVRHVDHRGR